MGVGMKTVNQKKQPKSWHNILYRKQIMWWHFVRRGLSDGDHQVNLASIYGEKAIERKIAVYGGIANIKT